MSAWATSRAARTSGAMLERRGDLGRRHPKVAVARTVEARGQFAEGVVAPLTDVGQDLPDRTHGRLDRRRGSGQPTARSVMPRRSRRFSTATLPTAPNAPNEMGRLALSLRHRTLLSMPPPSTTSLDRVTEPVDQSTARDREDLGRRPLRGRTPPAAAQPPLSALSPRAPATGTETRRRTATGRSGERPRRATPGGGSRVTGTGACRSCLRAQVRPAASLTACGGTTHADVPSCAASVIPPKRDPDSEVSRRLRCGQKSVRTHSPQLGLRATHTPAVEDQPKAEDPPLRPAPSG